MLIFFEPCLVFGTREYLSTQTVFLFAFGTENGAQGKFRVQCLLEDPFQGMPQSIQGGAGRRSERDQYLELT